MTTTKAPLTEPPAEVSAGPAPIHPSDIPTTLIVACLAPMFLTASGGDLVFARMAARQTVSAYHARDPAGLIAIAQIIAFGLAALGSLSLSMADDISVSMTLRLRGNANALNRSAEQNRRVLRESCADGWTPRHADRIVADTTAGVGPADAQYEAEVLASVAETQKRVAETRARLEDAEPAAGQAPLAAPSPIAVPRVAVPLMTERQLQVTWAEAMTDVAGEFTASLPHLPPAERWAASRRAAALSSTANELISGVDPPRLRPGALGAIIRPNGA